MRGVRQTERVCACRANMPLERQRRGDLYCLIDHQAQAE